MTLSFVELDRETGTFRIGSASYPPSLAKNMHGIRPGAGAVLLQARFFSEPRAAMKLVLDEMEAGATPTSAVAALRHRHPEHWEQRQVVAISTSGAVAISRSRDCRAHISIHSASKGSGIVVAATNTTTSPAIAEAMTAAWRPRNDDLRSAARSRAADVLRAGTAVGTDIRGLRSAAVTGDWEGEVSHLAIDGHLDPLEALKSSDGRWQPMPVAWNDPFQRPIKGAYAALNKEDASPSEIEEALAQVLTIDRTYSEVIDFTIVRALSQLGQVDAARQRFAQLPPGWQSLLTGSRLPLDRRICDTLGLPSDPLDRDSISMSSR